MCGYWKEKYIGYRAKIGPIRTCIKCMEEYIEWYDNPNKEIISRTNTMVNPNNIGIKIKEYKVPIISDVFCGKNLYREECNKYREKDKKLSD